MVRKITEKKGVTKKKLKTKKAPETKKDNSIGIMLLAGLGLILLIYLGSTVTVDVELDLSNSKSDNNTELVGESIVISGKPYSSKATANTILKGIPQSKLTDEEIEFVEGYQN